MRYEFNGFVLDTDRVELTKEGGRIALEPKVFALLVFLVENRDRVVSKDEILDQVWPGVYVSDTSISSAVKHVRQALNDDGAAQRTVRTIWGKGFRFVADLQEAHAAVPAAPGRDRLSQHLPNNRPTIAIRPFQLIGGLAEHSAIAEAIPAELIAALSKLRWIRVIARASSFQFADGARDIGEMATMLGAQYAVSGLVELFGSDMAVSVELSDTRNGEVVWTNRLSGKLEALFEMRAQIALELATALEIRLPLHEAAKLDHTCSEHLDAWDHYHLGVRHMYRYNKQDNGKAALHFGKALELDPSFARAASGLSYTEFQNAFQHFGSDASHHRKLAIDHAEQGMSLDPLDPFCNLTYGRVKWLMGDPESAMVWVNNAIMTNPNYAFGYFQPRNALQCSLQRPRRRRECRPFARVEPS